MNYQEVLEDACKRYEEAVSALAVSESAYKDLDSQVKTKLAEAYNRAIGTSSKEREMLALSDETYRDWLSVVSLARATYLKDRSCRDIQEKRWDTARSSLSMEKAKTRIL